MALSINVTIGAQGAEVLKNVKKDVLSLDNAVKAGIAAFGTYFAVDKIISFGKASVAAYEQSEMAVSKLTIAMGYRSQALLDQASALQNTTRFEDDSITSMQSLLATFKLSESQIKALTPTILDMAQATGVDLDQAAMKVGKTIGTKTNALARDGIEIDKTASKTERFNEVLGKLSDRFAGQAAGAIGVGTGKIALLSNKFSDLQENIGQMIVQNTFFVKALELASKVTGKLQEMTSQLNDEYEVKDSDLIEYTDTVLNLSEAMAKSVPVTAAYGTTLASFNQGKFGSEQGIADAMKNIQTVTVAADVSMVNFTKTVDKIKAKNRAIADRKKADEKKPVEEDSGEFKDYTDQQLNELVNRYEGENYTVAKYLQERALTRLQYSQTEEDASAKEIEMFALKYSEEKKYHDLSMQLSIDKISMIGTMIGAFAQLNTALKGNAKVTQALLIGETIMNTSAAIMKIMAQGGAFAVPLAIATGIQGAAQVATIASQKFADGGWVQGNGNSRSDNVPAMLSPRERVLSVKEINRMGGEQAVDRAVYAGNRGGVTLNIQGSVIAHKDWIREELMPVLEREASR